MKSFQVFMMKEVIGGADVIRLNPAGTASPAEHRLPAYDYKRRFTFYIERVAGTASRQRQRQRELCSVCVCESV